MAEVAHGLAPELAGVIRDVPDFPIPGILFRDITTLLQDADAFHKAVDAMIEPFRSSNVGVVAGVESRGFIFATPVAYALGAGFVPVRKLGRLPAESIRVEYALEYGTNTLEMHRDAIKPGQRVLLVDDLLATGGTAVAAIDLVRRLGGEVVGASFLVELTELGGRAQLAAANVHAVVRY
jgi:adenine phosphoribosyltransferase